MRGFGTTTQDSQRHRYVGFPGIEPYDVLVTEDNQRYRLCQSEWYLHAWN
jgi:hypothetical protein